MLLNVSPQSPLVSSEVASEAGEEIHCSTPDGNGKLFLLLYIFLFLPSTLFKAEKERLGGEVKDLKHKVKFLQDQLVPITRQREYQEKEIVRLNEVGIPY